MKTLLIAMCLMFFVPVANADAGPDAGVSAPDPVADAEGDVVGTVGKLLQSAKEGNWRMFFAFLIVVMMVALKYIKTTFGTDWGKRYGAVWLMLITFGTGLSAALITGTPVTFQALLAIVSTAFMACGGYTWFRDVFGKQPDAK